MHSFWICVSLHWQHAETGSFEANYDTKVIFYIVCQRHNTTWAFQVTREESSKKLGLDGWSSSCLWGHYWISKLDGVCLDNSSEARLRFYLISTPHPLIGLVKTRHCRSRSVKWNIRSYPLISTLISIGTLILCSSLQTNEGSLSTDSSQQYSTVKYMHPMHP